MGVISPDPVPAGIASPTVGGHAGASSQTKQKRISAPWPTNRSVPGLSALFLDALRRWCVLRSPRNTRGLYVEPTHRLKANARATLGNVDAGYGGSLEIQNDRAL